jgi:hypothetical protein
VKKQQEINGLTYDVFRSRVIEICNEWGDTPDASILKLTALWAKLATLCKYGDITSDITTKING